MKKIQLSILSLSTALLLSSCYYDNFKELHPEGALPNANVGGCDTVAVISYSAQIAPILVAGCNSCHNGNVAHDMTTWAGANADALSGKFYGSVAQDGTAQNMPQGGSKISDCDIAKIKKWAAAGAPQN